MADAGEWLGGHIDRIASAAGDFFGAGGAALEAGAGGGRLGQLFTGAIGNLGGAGAETAGGYAGAFGGVGDLFSGAGKLMSGNIGGGVGDLVSGGAGLIGTGLGSTFEHAGPIGAAVGGTAQAIGNIYEMTQHSQDRNGDYWDNKFWGAAGDATIGALHAGLGSWCPVAEMYISAGELGLDAVGGLAGLVGDGIDGLGSLTGLWDSDNEWGFGAGDVVGMGLHLGHDAINGIGSLLGGGADVIGDAGSWIGDTAGDVWDALPSIF